MAVRTASPMSAKVSLPEWLSPSAAAAAASLVSVTTYHTVSPLAMRPR